MSLLISLHILGTNQIVMLSSAIPEKSHLSTRRRERLFLYMFVVRFGLKTILSWAKPCIEFGSVRNHTTPFILPC